MSRLHKRRMIIILVGLIILTIIISLITYSLRQNISLFYTPTQLINNLTKNNFQITRQVVRIGGMVKKGSVLRSAQDLTVTFALTDFKTTVPVEYTGILPDLFRDGQGIVATGKFTVDGCFKAIEILAKHDANYMPPEIKSILRATHG
ncbi:MAG: cytochrome c biogenesis protein CcmE [Legionellales bacterium RIFCSPHIGHO2_12_FULL_35_11]|nr:MAG: cytochrome c biogenesis protein CcmE [Legionellales bacterium RIFCSPHIGHO2_12_FULL_35_11]